MATRKLQTEIDKVFKKVAEGVETFEDIYEKMQTTTNANQKEKYESDLKKEIKKLQRQRDQIKTWISSNDVKDKRALMDNRRLIEQQMEKFKACEKEMKTKAYSSKGLSMSGRLDPKEKEKAETCAWVTERVESLNIQIEALEAEVETLAVGAKKGKKDPARERIVELEEKIERHKWHQGRLELILRLLENGQIDTEKVQHIQEDVNYYVDENQDPDFAEDDEIYTDLNLEEEEDYFAIGQDDHHHDDGDTPSKDEHPDPPAKRQPKEPEPEPSPSRTTAKPVPTKKLSVSEPKEPKLPVPSASPSLASNSTPAAPTRQSTGPRPVPVESPAIQYATAAAANLPTEVPRVPVSVSPHVAPAVISQESERFQDSPTPMNATLAQGTSPSTAPASASKESPAPSTPLVASSPPKASPVLAAPAAATPSPSKVAATPATAASASASPATKPVAVATPAMEPTKAPTETSSTQPSQSQSPSVASAEKAQDEKASAPPTQTPAQAQAPSTPTEVEIRLPAALADLALSFEASKERVLSKDVTHFAHQMLEASYQYIPEQADTERPKHYVPKNPYPAPSYYPQIPPQGLFDSPALFEKMDLDTLFFIFYYQQGTYQQYLAARELKKQSWRFHKKYLTWFQRHEEPKAITDEFEQGTYIYFDYEGAWCQRKKTDFRFEYKFLEDSELV